jgi:hypothetical protein
VLRLGLPPDGNDARLPVDEEWQIEWSKHYIGLDLAHAYAATGDARYVGTWQTLVESWIAQMPVGAMTSDVSARRIQNWIYAWDEITRAGGHSLIEMLEAPLAQRIAAETDELRANLTAERNHRTLELYTLLLVSLALPQLDPDEELREFACDALTENLLTDVWADGVHRECSTHYHLIALRSFVAARENARRAGVAFPAAYDRHLAAACEFAMHCQRPDGSIPAFSDSDEGHYGEVLLLAGELLGRPDFVFAATGGAKGQAPDRRCVHFPVGGYYVQRSGWGTRRPLSDERFLMLDCGPLGDGGHGHYDLLSVEVASGERNLIVDPGRCTYSEAGQRNWRQHFKGTAAHNTVCVDGLDQQPYRRGKPKGPQAVAHAVRQVGCSFLDIVVAEAESPSYDAHHRRTVIFVAGEYWLIVDELSSTSVHDYRLRYQLSPAAAGLTALDGQTVTAPGVALLTSGGTVSLETGWVSPSYGKRLMAPAVVARAAGTSARFLTAIVPREDSDPVPELVGLSDRSAAVRGIAGGATDVLSWADDVEERCFGPLTCNADVAWVRICDGALDRGVVHGTTLSVAPGRVVHRTVDAGWEFLEGAKR